MRLPELQRILVEGARRQERPRVHRRLFARMRARPLIALLPVLVVGAGSAGAVVAITATKSKPLSGTIAQVRGGPLHYAISVFPTMKVGSSGWHARVQYSNVHGRQGYGENSQATGMLGSAQLVESLSGGEAGSEAFGVVGGAVAAVRLEDGQNVTPISSPRLPHGTRAFFVIGPPLEYREPLRIEPTVFLDSHGRPIPEHFARSALQDLPLRRLDPRRPGNAPCALHLKEGVSIVAIRQTISAPGPWPTPEPDALLSCANATYRVAGGTVAVAVLVNATDPRLRAPGLPGVTPESAHPGIAAGRELGSIEFARGINNRDVSARREGVTWLVAEGGTATERARLLRVLSTHG